MKAIIITIPGIGSHESNFSEGFKADVKRFAKGTILENQFLVKEMLPFSKTDVDDNQKALFSRLKSSSELGGVLSLRKFVLQAFGDAVTYESGKSRSDSVYQSVHNYLREEFKQINEKLVDYPEAKLFIVAASMGVHIISTYIWDADKGRGVFNNNPAEQDESLTNLSALFSIGCNIPLFVSGKSEDQIVPFSKPNPDFIWENYYDRDDVLGWPLSNLSQGYKELVTDHEINTGQYIGSHLRYWKDNDFTKPFVKTVERIILNC